MTDKPAENPDVVRVVIIDHSAVKHPTAELETVAAALEQQVNEQFGLPAPAGWGCRVQVSVDTAPQPGEWVLGLFDHPDQPGALGYHERTKTGLPVMKVFPLLCAQDGVSWSSCASHELLETLADPETCRAAQDRLGQFWALEVCDGVEQDTYVIDGVEVSNFALPAYFEPPRSRTVKFDWLGLCKGPLEIRPGGYNQVYDSGAGWVQKKMGELSGYRAKVGSRRQARRLNRH
jgi:hypothetical protein